jgi:hypothetical protein
VRSKTGRAIMNGHVSRTHVRRVSIGAIPDQTQKPRTIVKSIKAYLFDDTLSPSENFVLDEPNSAANPLRVSTHEHDKALFFCDAATWSGVGLSHRSSSYLESKTITNLWLWNKISPSPAFHLIEETQGR